MHQEAVQAQQFGVNHQVTSYRGTTTDNDPAFPLANRAHYPSVEWRVNTLVARLT